VREERYRGERERDRGLTERQGRKVREKQREGEEGRG